MTYEIRKQKMKYGYTVIDNCTNTTVAENLYLDEANRFCWQKQGTEKRYQILANSWANRHELTWYSNSGDLIITNGFATIEEARLAIVEDHKELCFKNDHATHPNPEGDYSIIDTFTGEEIDYSISEEEASHPNPLFRCPDEV